MAEASAKRRIVVAGEMLELGSGEAEIHRDTGQQIAKSGVDMLLGVRGLAREMVAGAKDAGLKATQFVETSDVAGELLVGQIKEGDLVLVKGSRGVRTEKVIEKLLEKFELEEKDSATR